MVRFPSPFYGATGIQNRRLSNGVASVTTEHRAKGFVPGPLERREKDWVGAEQQLKEVLARLPWLKLAASEIVGGAFNPANPRFPFNLIPPLRKMPASDARDWTVIRAWANGLAVILHA